MMITTKDYPGKLRLKFGSRTALKLHTSFLSRNGHCQMRQSLSRDGCYLRFVKNVTETTIRKKIIGIFVVDMRV
jgi:hypothetical protein